MIRGGQGHAFLPKVGSLLVCSAEVGGVCGQENAEAKATVLKKRDRSETRRLAAGWRDLMHPE